MPNFRLKWRDAPIIILVILITGLFIFGTYHYTDSRLRSEYLQVAHRLADSIPLEQISALSGEITDLNNPSYDQLKQHLVLVQQAFPKYRFLYIMGEKPDGSIFFYIDSELPGSADQSLPGDIYLDVTPDFLSIFTTGEAATQGPDSDQWGTWISALVPISGKQENTQTVVFGMDIDASDWNTLVQRQIFTPVILVVVLAWISILSLALFHARVSFPDHLKIKWLRQHAEGISVFVIGLVLTCIAAWFANQNEMHARQETFERLASAKTGHISSRMHSLETIEMEGLAQFFLASEEVDQQEFDIYIEHLLTDPIVSPWAYIPEVSFEDREQFEANASANSFSEYRIWEEDVDGSRLPASPRNRYYPVLYYKSEEENDPMLGFDFGSDPIRFSGIEAAARAGRSIATDPVLLKQGSSATSDVMIFKPISHGTSTHSTGYLLATLNLDLLLNTYPENRDGQKSAVNMDLLQLQPGQLPLSLFSNATEAISEQDALNGLYEHPGTRSTYIQLYQAFGKSYAVVARPSAQFEALYPVTALQNFLVLGLLLTFMAAALTNQATNQRYTLNHLVNERTAKLKESEDKLSTLIDNLPGFVYRCANNPDFTMEFITEGCKEITGYAPDEFISSQTIAYNSIIQADYQEAVWSKWQLVLDRKEAFEDEYPITTASGDTRWVWERGQGIFSDAGELLYLEGFITDITEKKLAEEQLFAAQIELRKILDGANNSRRMLLSVIEDQNQAEEALRNVKEFNESIVQTMSDAIAVIDRKGIITFANPALARLLGCKIDEIIGQSWMTYIAPGQIEFAQTINERGIGDSGSRLELTLLLKGDEVRSVLASGSPLVDPKTDEPFATLVAITDISERKQIEEQIRSRNQELSTLYKLSRELAVADSLDQILEVVNRHAVESIQVTVARVALIEGNQLIVRAAHPIRVMDQDLSVGIHMPINALPHCSRVLQDHVPLTFTSSDEDFHSEERSILLLDTTHSTCLIPLRVGDTAYNSGHPLGLLILNEARRRDEHTFTPEKIRLASSIGDQAATAIRRMRLHDDTQRHLRYLTALSEIDRTITSSFDLSFSLETVLFQVKTQLHVDAACIRLISPETRMLHIASELGFRKSPRPPSYVRLGADYAGRIALERRSIYVASLKDEERSADLLNDMQGEDFACYFGLPLIAKGQVHGVLEVFNRTPLEPEEEWLDFLKALAEQAAIAIDNATMFDHLQRSNTELTLAYNDTIEGLSRALDLRDQNTEGHSRRVTELTQRIAMLFNVSQDELLQMRWGALMHDIGKMAIPDNILLKPGPLSDEEWGIMRFHPVLAFEMLSPIRFLRNALDIPYCHHEMWDGSGYPRGLKGEQIPLAARIFAIADVWDALLSDRPYRPAWTKDQARAYLLEKAGSLFDPKIVKACFAARIFDEDVIDEISSR